MIEMTLLIVNIVLLQWVTYFHVSNYNNEIWSKPSMAVSAKPINELSLKADANLTIWD